MRERFSKQNRKKTSGVVLKGGKMLPYQFQHSCQFIPFIHSLPAGKSWILFQKPSSVHTPIPELFSFFLWQEVPVRNTELTSHHQPGKVKRRHHVSDHLPESSLLASILTEQRWATRKDPELEWLTRDNPETNPVTIKPKTESHLAEQVDSFTLYPLPLCPDTPSQ